MLSQLRGLDLKARLIVEGFVAGLHRSPYHGFSVEFAEHREYVPGDDLRHVDWKVYGKSDRYYLKQFEEETNFACHFIIDASESMGYRSETAPLSKLEYAKHLAAALAYLVIQQQDAAGLATLDTGVREYVPPSSQPSHLRLLLHRLEECQPAGETQLGPVLHDLAERIRKRGVIILLSDLFDDAPSLLAGLKHFRYRRHDVSVMQIIDPAEQDFPFDQPTRFVGMEQLAEQQADPRTIADAYRREFDRFLTETKHLIRDLGMDHSLIRTDQSLDAALRAFLQTRSRFAGHV
ncbi:DUF58 domain-containing protein [bacterium]|nr:DUF58 domain-containing protein [bacterium]